MLVASASAVGLHYSLPPALGERRHRGLACRLVAVGWTRSSRCRVAWHCRHLHDTADYGRAFERVR